MNMRAYRLGNRHSSVLALVVVGVVLSAFSLAHAATLISHGESWKYKKGTMEASDPLDAWRDVDYDDSGWSTGTAPVGYPSGAVSTYLSDMQSSYSTIFLRKHFTVSAFDEETRLRAVVKYDDGFILWINGERVCDENEPDGSPTHDALAGGYVSGVATQVFELSDPEGYLEVGDNVIAVQVFNSSIGSGDCLADVELSTYKRVADTKFSHDRGFYDSAFDVTIRTATAGATIRYTTDGSAPTPSNGSGTGTNEVVSIPTTTFLRAAAFKADYEPTDIDTHTYIFADHVIDQARPSGFPTEFTNATYGGYVPVTYDMDSGLVGTYGRSAVENSLKGLPTLSIVGSYADMFATGGVLSAPSNQAEYACSAELIYPDQSHEGFQINCGIRGHKTWGTAKVTRRLLFKDEFGPTKLRYPIFETDPVTAEHGVDRFDRLVLRAGANTGVASSGDNCYRTVYARDPFVKATQVEMTGIGSQSTFMHVYFNGLYWGLYNPCERPDHSFSAEHFGGAKEDWFACNHGFDSYADTVSWKDRDPEPINGDRARYDYLVDTLIDRDLSVSNNYAELGEYVDIQQLVDYMLCCFYSGTKDWPGNNWYAGYLQTPTPQPLQSYVWDAEGSLNLWGMFPNFSEVYVLGSKQYVYQSDHARLWRAVDNNVNFRMLVADRAYKYTHDDGPLTDANSRARWLALAAFIEPGFMAESVRWGTYKNPGTPVTTNHWGAERDAVSDLFTGASDRLKTMFRDNSTPLYPTIDAPEFSPSPGAIGAGFTLTMTNPNGSVGTIFYKTGGGDPRLYGGTKAGSAVQYTGPVAMTKTTYIRARVYKNAATWSPVHAATYSYTAHHPLLRISEIHYNPLGGGEYEFIELQNVSGSTTIGLSEMTFDKGLTYTFAPGTELGPGKFAVLVRNESAFTNRYPDVKGSADVELFGVYAGALDNGGERLTLMDSAGNEVTSVRYNDKDPWPGDADGDGFSLVWAGTGDQDDPAKWRASNLIGGSPGYDEGAAYRVVINEALTHTDPPSLDTIELCNVGDTSVDIGGWWLSDSDNNYKKYEIPTPTVVGADGYVLFDESDFNTDTNDPSCFALSSHGDEIYLTKWDSHGNLQYLAEARFGGAENARAFGRYITSDGDADFVAQSQTNTLGSANAYPLVGPVVINELMYHPARGGDEFIELKNISDATVPLYDPAVPTNTWRLDGAIEYMFPTGVVMAPGELILVVATNSRTGFRTKYSVPAEVEIYKQYLGALNNGGESLKLWRPDTPDPEGTPWILVDRVKYNDNSPWPESADGRGPSLERIAPTLYGNDVANWSASALSNGTPGVANSGILVSKTAGWRYHDRGANLGTGWRAGGYDDSAWEDGNAMLGYPDTNPEIDTEVEYGDDPANKHITTYFRKAFLSDAEIAEVQSLALRIRYDDGYVAYLNGDEVARGGMAAGTVNYDTLANVNGGSGAAYETVNLNGHIGKLAQGLNVLAVEIHQISGTSSDIRMDLELEYEVLEQGRVATPSFAPPAGTFTNSVNVTVSTATSGATVFYTTDGADPSDSSYDGSGLNSVQVALNATRTLKAKAYMDGLLASHTASAQYTKWAPLVGFAAGSSSGGEDVNGSLTVALSGTSAEQVRVSYAVSGGTATGGVDYTLAAGTLTFSPGQTSKALTILVDDDDEEEGNETVEVTLSSPVNANLGTSVHTYTIEDNDAPIVMFTAYNDLAWDTGQPDTNITKHSRGESGLLVDYPSGDPTDVTLTVDLGGVGPWQQGAHPDAGTDAHDVFDGIVDCAGLISYADTNVTLSFSGMDPTLAYTLVLFNNRDKYEDRNTKYILAGADSFANESSAGATVSTVAMPNDATQIIASNTVDGLVAKYTQIKPGSDGSILVTVDGTQPYVNALMLQAIQMPGPSMDVVVAQGADWRYHKGTTEASDPATAWHARIFDDASWATDPASFGYGSGSYGTTLDMEDNYSSVSFRKSFAVSDAERVNRLDVKVYYDDGFILWLNGQELIRQNVQGNAGEFVAHDATCSGYVGGTPGIHTVTLEGAVLPELLVSGNCVAVQVFNNTLSSSDAYFDAELAVARSELSDSEDADANGLRDDWQAAQGTTQAASVDEDGDGLSNLDEYVLGTGATDSNDFFALDLGLVGSDLCVSFEAAAATGTGYDGLGLSRHFQLQSRTALDAQSIWAAIVGYEDITGGGQTVCYTNTAPGAAYYRARVWLEED